MAITVDVEIGGLLAKPQGKSAVRPTLENGAVVRDMLAAIGFKKEHIPRIVVSVNGTVRKLDFDLRDGDIIKLSILVGGG
ncbi:MAG: MoaD/ThiS family protein [Elusimicrobiota bacterium]